MDPLVFTVDIGRPKERMRFRSFADGVHVAVHRTYEYSSFRDRESDQFFVVIAGNVFQPEENKLIPAHVLKEEVWLARLVAGVQMPSVQHHTGKNQLLSGVLQVFSIKQPLAIFPKECTVMKLSYLTFTLSKVR